MLREGSSIDEFRERFGEIMWSSLLHRLLDINACHCVSSEFSAEFGAPCMNRMNMVHLGVMDHTVK